jgi:pimeloyl-ACP methyl ester carboxylesterase
MPPLSAAVETYVTVGKERSVDIQLWCRIWGNPAGFPVLFVHGGPGNCIADYCNINETFFDSEKFYVFEVDQRGTGKSLPSIRDDVGNMQFFKNISIATMACDFEKVRKYVGVKRWLVFGGSWGSTLGLYYCETYPEKSLGLIIRGIFLNTAEEFGAVYGRKGLKQALQRGIEAKKSLSQPSGTPGPYDGDEGLEMRLAEFEVYHDVAVKESERRGEIAPSPDDGERIMRIYEDLIQAGDRSAIWKFYVVSYCV